MDSFVPSICEKCLLPDEEQNQRTGGAGGMVVLRTAHPRVGGLPSSPRAAQDHLLLDDPSLCHEHGSIKAPFHVLFVPFPIRTSTFPQFQVENPCLPLTSLPKFPMLHEASLRGRMLGSRAGRVPSNLP